MSILDTNLELPWRFRLPRLRGSDETSRTKSRQTGRHINYRYLMILLVFLALLTWAVYPPMVMRMEQGRQIDSLSRQIEDLETKNASLSREITRLQTPEYIEVIARDQLGLVRPGQESYLVVDPDEWEKRADAPAVSEAPQVRR